MGKKISKKVQKKITDELNQTGLRILDIRTDRKPGLLFMCLTKALMVFLVCCGTVTGFCEAYALPYNRPLIITYTALASVVVAMLYYKKWLFLVGYPLILVLYTVEIVRYYRYANSGFQAIVNTVRIGFADYYDMTFVKNIEEFIENRYITITITLMFIILFMVILFNITVSRYMNLAETVGISFVLLEFALYIEKKPPLICVLMIMTGCVCIGILQRGAWMRTIVSSTSDDEFIYDRIFKKRIYTTRGSSISVLMVLAFSLVFSAIICISSIGIYNNSAGETEEDSVKASIDDYVQVFVRNGLTGLFDRYDSVNGLNSGILGGVASVRPDFMTDIVVSFVPSGTDTVYLPGFRASSYYSSNWSSIVRFDDERLDEIRKERGEEDTIQDGTVTTESGLSYQFGEATRKFDEALYGSYLDRYPKKNMEITYFDEWFGDLSPYITMKEDVHKVLFPAYLYARDTEGKEIEGNGPSKSMEYVPLDSIDYINNNPAADISGLPAEYEYYVYHSCIEIPNEIKEYFDISFFPGHPELEMLKNEKLYVRKGGDVYDTVNQYRLRACDAVRRMFLAEYPYTLTPGRTPTNKDFIRYFLEEQKRGYCSYFASSAVMLLRNMGIPARYTEGYCIPYSLVKEKGREIPDADAERAGLSVSGEQKAVSVEVSDYYAHAWIEIYLEGVGFVPYEVTPPSFETAGMNSPLSGLGNLFQRLLSVDLGLGDISEGTLSFQGDSGLTVDSDKKSDSDFVFVPVIVTILIAAAVWLIYLLIRRMLYLCRLKAMLAAGDFAGLVHIRYYELVSFLKRKKLIMEDNPMPMELAALLTGSGFLRKLKANAADTSELLNAGKWFDYVERVLYSENIGTGDEYEAFVLWIKKMKRTINGKDN